MRGAVILVLVGLIAIVGLTSSVPVFTEGLSVQRQRFQSGGGVEQGIVMRFAQDFMAAGASLSHAPTLGLGLGVGTNVGAKLLSGHAEFALGEGEWQRVIMESGPTLGVAYIVLRCAMLLVIVAVALKAYRTGKILPLLLVGAGGLDLATAQFGQPTTLGFAVFAAGLALSAAQKPGQEPPPCPVPPPPAAVAIRGRSSYAERLHGNGAG
jgi:hypothetical protein